MKAVNKQAAKVLDKLVEGVNGSVKKVDNRPGDFMAVSIERLWDSDHFACFAVAHYYEQNGDLMADPSMEFIRDKAGNYYPTFYRQDNLGLSQESVIFDGYQIKGYRPAWQKDQAVFAGLWMKNIKMQQGI